MRFQGVQYQQSKGSEKKTNIILSNSMLSFASPVFPFKLLAVVIKWKQATKSQTSKAKTQE
jgi:hypothetical protein